jgi:hypothetical protein
VVDAAYESARTGQVAEVRLLQTITAER